MSQPDRHLLVVDDDDRIRELLREFLGRAGFRVTSAADAASAWRFVEAFDFDLIVLDFMMPGEDGVAFTRRLRARTDQPGRTPVLMLTARGEANDRIDGLTAGVDDYLAKPFEPRELLLRIEAILRRAGPREVGPSSLSLGECAFDIERGELTRNGAQIRLTEAEIELMRRLAKSANAPVDRLELARDTADITGRAVDVQVTRLRRKIEVDSKNPRYLQTVRGVGYRLAPD